MRTMWIPKQADAGDRGLAFTVGMVLVLLAVAWVFSGSMAPHAYGGVNSVVNSPHNLSASGPGNIRAQSEQEVCVFCHTPHKANPVLPLWNRSLSVASYKPYSSNSLSAAPGQPTGSSKLCLSCHDGTIALGDILSRGQIAMANGVTVLPVGSTNLGTDLSNSHPISFRYDTALTIANPKLKSPSGLPAGVRLDHNQELQCSSCHSAHDDSRGKFLVMANPNGELCNGCHTMGTTDAIPHQPCASCHQSHLAPSGAYLLTQSTQVNTCLPCHNGSPNANAGVNIAPDLTKTDVHTSTDPSAMSTCSDCHEPHTVQTTVGTSGSAISAPLVQPAIGRTTAATPTVLGTSTALTGTAAGTIRSGRAGANSPAKYEYQVCLKCHSANNTVRVVVTRQIAQNNLQLQFNPAAVSFHPIEAIGRNDDVPSLKPGYTVSSMIYCTDCHGSDTSRKAGGTGPNGPHGSKFKPLLLARYDTQDQNPESPATYALCYRCHDRTNLLSNQSFPLHKKHIVDQRTPCSACHDSHGVPSAQGTTMNNFALINFDTTIVRPDALTKRLEYDHLGNRVGKCYLLCHSHNHSGAAY